MLRWDSVPGLTGFAAVVAAVALASGSGCADAGGDPARGFEVRDLGPQELLPISFDIGDTLEELPGLEVVEVVEEVPEGYRMFEISIEQPADHGDLDGETFPQRMILLHRDEGAPVVMSTLGYGLSGRRPGELTGLLGANQLSVEHRYFGPSRPEGPGFEHLDIWQAATDHHRIVELLRPLYAASWVTTGASKGGMTATYHRRFYPDDVDATVAYVAPLSFGRNDWRYVPFLASVGPPECNQRVRDFQRAALERREAVIPKLEELLAEFEVAIAPEIGIEAAYEIAVAEHLFGFWQSFRPERCETVPESSAADDAFVDELLGTIFFSTEAGLESFAPYYVQAASQLGYPRLPLDHIDDLLTLDPNDYSLYVGDAAPAEFDSAAMADIAHWARFDAERVIYIYGDHDPWTAGAYPFSHVTGNDTHQFVVAGGNHGAGLRRLSSEDRTRAFEVLARWTGVEIVAQEPMREPAEPAFTEVAEPFANWPERLRRRLRPPL